MVTMFLPYEIMITTNYKLSYFSINFDWKSTLGAIHKLRRQDFTNFRPNLPLRRQVYYISLCSSIGIWLTPLSPT